MATATGAVTSRSTSDMGIAELKARIAQLEAEKAERDSASKQKITFKTSLKPNLAFVPSYITVDGKRIVENEQERYVKGGVIMYGMQRFPITLKPEQWALMVALVHDGTLEKAIEQHREGKLETKIVLPQDGEAKAGK